MNLIRGFKRITRVLAIVIAVACGIFAGFLAVQQYDDANTVRANPFSRVLYLEKRIARTEENIRVLGNMNMDKDAQGADSSIKQSLMSSVIEDKKALDNERKRLKVLEKEREKRFWYNLPIAQLIGMVVLCGLGGAVAGYVGTWVILWYGGLAIFILIGWLILGFADEKPKDEQKQ